MSIFWVLISMAGGAAISELYHNRMWARYQQGKREGREYSSASVERHVSPEVLSTTYTRRTKV